MSRKLDSPVQTQMAIAVANRTFRNEFHGNRTDGKPVGRRRVFVQTDTGCVLGMDLDRSDNVHTVKRRLQLALNVPTDESSLTFGDVVLKNDLSAVRNDSPLLLRRNFMHRSSSTPCLSPTVKDLHHRDRSGPVEIVGCSSRFGGTRQLVKEVVNAISAGVEPIPVHSGLGGAYYFRNIHGESIAIVKPTDEEPFAPNNPKGFVGKALGQPGLKRSVRVGETGFREVAAYLLDYDHFANVPPTVLVKITHPIFHVNEVSACSNKSCDRKPRMFSKIASFQQFIRHDFDASDHGTSSFPVAAVHRIGILDIRIFNTDRHAGNLLVRKVDGGVGKFGGSMELIPIDHGLCLPETLEDPYFEWIHWPQASIPFSEDELEYIAKLDPMKDCDMLRMELPMIREACLKVLVLCTIFLKEAADFGLCLGEIGEMMSREFRGVEEEPSELEVVCIEARRLVREERDGKSSSETETPEDDDYQFDIDCEDDDFTMRKLSPTYRHGLKGGRNPFSKLASLDEEEDEAEDDMSSTLSLGHPVYAHAPPPTMSRLSMSLNGVNLSSKGSNMLANHPKFETSMINKSNLGSGGMQGAARRSANEQLPVSASFVKIADMEDDEWASFLEKVHELLPAAFRDRKCAAAGQRQHQRLGTSCQF